MTLAAGLSAAGMIAVGLEQTAAAEAPQGLGAPAGWTQRGAPPGGAGPGGQGGVAGGCASGVLSQSGVPDVVIAGNTAMCVNNAPPFTEANGLARAFTIPAGAEIAVQCVDFAVEENQGGAWPVKVNLYTGLIDGPFAELTWIAESDLVTIPDGAALELFTAPFSQPVVVPAGASIVVELFVASRNPDEGGDGGAIFLGSNNLGESAPSYVRAPSCGAADFLPYGSLGFPGVHLLMAVGVEPLDKIAGACCFSDCLLPCCHLTPSDCAAGGGSFLGINVSCASNPCEPKNVLMGCCLEDSSIFPPIYWCQDLTPAACLGANGTVLDDLCAFTDDCPPIIDDTPCPADIDDSGGVDVSDLVLLVLDWGCAAADCLGDVTGDGQTNVTDLVDLVLAWGNCK
jgi:hypothetical protein